MKPLTQTTGTRKAPLPTDSRSPALLLLLLSLATGCGGSARSEVQRKYEPALAAAKAIETYDSNHDGKLSAGELKSCPALRGSIPRIDRNADGNLTADELQARLTEIDSQADFIGLDVHVTYKGRPLVGAELTLTPEKFMSEGAQSYSGTTITGGLCPLRGERVQVPGVPPAFYQVRIVHAEHGLDVVRGCEIAEDTTGNRLRFAL
jgi:hypothetical protein